MRCRCECYVIDTETHRTRKCKLKPQFKFDKKYCNIHAKKFLSMYALIIQKYFRRFRIAQKLKKLFYPLPRDLQRRVLFYIREPYLLEKHHYNPISKIVCKKMHKLMSKQAFHFFIQRDVSIIQEKIILASFVENLRLFTKYLIILDQDDLSRANNVLNKLYFRRISRSDANYKSWTDFYDILRDYYKKMTQHGHSISGFNSIPTTTSGISHW